MTSRSEIPPAPTGEHPIGRVETDSKGNRVWKWVAQGLDSTTRLLARLTDNDLALEETGPRKDPSDVFDGDRKPFRREERSKTRSRTGESNEKLHLSLTRPDSDTQNAGVDPYNSSDNGEPRRRG